LSDENLIAKNSQEKGQLIVQRPTLIKNRQGKGQTDCLKARRNAKRCGIAIPLSQETSKLQEYH